MRRAFKNLARCLLETYTGFEIDRFGYRSFALFEKKRREHAWFSYRAQMRAIFDKYKINLVIDVGANEGQFARGIRSFYLGEILSFEPVTSTFDKLVAAASSDPNWHVYKYALGRNNSSQSINISNITEFSSFLKANDYCALRFGSGALRMKEEFVYIRRLDELLDIIVPDIESKRIFIKLDTQGYDVEVFKGLGSKVKYLNALQSEVSLIPIYKSMPHWTESILTYEKEGFRVVGMFPESRDSGKVIEYNCLLTKDGFQ